MVEVADQIDGLYRPRVKSPTVVDRAFQLAYVCAYRLMRVYWKVRRPTTHGALVAVWQGGEVLLVKNSYVPYYTAPGGYVRSNESGRDAALRELREEVGVSVTPEKLKPALDETHDWEGKRDHVEIFNLDLDERPTVAVDHREVVAASWMRPETAIGLELFPPLRQVIRNRIEAGQAGR
jgi:ADP-ribose pyrophosphatase YjhB (NUDIX family)